MQHQEVHALSYMLGVLHIRSLQSQSLKTGFKCYSLKPRGSLPLHNISISGATIPCKTPQLKHSFCWIGLYLNKKTQIY